MYRVHGERVVLALDGPHVEVQPIHAWTVQAESAALSSSLRAARSVDAEYTALTRLYDHFVAEAQPQWDIVDHRGPVPATGAGLLHLPLELALAMISQWQDTLTVEKPAESEPAVAPTAVDAVVPPGPANAELKRRLSVARQHNARKAA